MGQAKGIDRGVREWVWEWESESEWEMEKSLLGQRTK